MNTKTCALPSGITFDGPWPGLDLGSFTDRNPESPSYGASFDLPLSTATHQAIKERWALKRAEFAAAGGSL